MKSDPYISKHYLGCFAVDQLPKRINKRPCFLVLNSSESYITEYGHWIAIAFYPKDVNIYFNTYGLPAHDDRIIKLLEPKYSCVSTPIQSINSSYCGHFCCLFLFLKARDYSFHEIMAIFNENNLKLNDSFAKFFFENTADFKISSRREDDRGTSLTTTTAIINSNNR
jgi:hypothetical protein